MTSCSDLRQLRRRMLLALSAVLAVVAPLVLVGPHRAAALTARPAVASTTSYSDPVFYPLRNPVLVGCITTNCPHADHKAFAINLDGRDKTPGDDAVYAMGAGVLHVGSPVGVNNCGSSSKPTLGNWVWIDHGGGVVSEYLHLYSVEKNLDGTYVTPSTEIGTMGYTGDNKCGTPYLDFFVRHGGIHGTNVAIKTLTACEGGTAVSYPSAFTNASTWADVTYKTALDRSQDSACLPTSFPSPSRPSAVKAKGQSHAATVRWTAPGVTEHVTGIQLEMQMYHPSTRSYSYPSFVAVKPAVTSTTVRGLSPKRTYRFLVSFHNHIGWSHGSSWTSATVH